ncbi:ImmA/IrrE family metallo-endopeptidase [Candidatus Enterococcus mansonii]|uniref:IrrE N-terminal-like domain-containing protein n=1 Tax=Candidatus Enterococcus mansonii TaxID=1834181 RepID=A0A242CE28_9ENTE|nr:ImmA/IrrE family metallo-endopeptidase [Enterococcus sp. 4G2_DIV0659]OTO08514.1 hypothetical protein A5880_001514 [Enterococcus sp. 4G2_DIV0659]
MFKYVNEYIDFSAKVNNYLLTLMMEKKINYDEYSDSYIWDLMKSQGVGIRGFYFKEKMNERISGMLIQDQQETTIVFNQRLDETMRHFVVSHEIIHYLFHKNERNNVFLDTQNHLEHFYQKELKEFQANIGASAILVPDNVFIHFLKNGWNLAQLSNRFKISEQHLSIRLVQMMQAFLGLSLMVSEALAEDIQYNFYGKGKMRAKLLAYELECYLNKTLVQRS